MRYLVHLSKQILAWGVLFWAREIAGWLLLVLGLLSFYQCFVWLVATPARPIEAVLPTIIGVVLFRGGLHMLKVSAAAQVCLRAQDNLEEAKLKPTVAPRTQSWRQ